MFEEQQRLNVELALKCNELAKAHAQAQARTFFLEDMLNIPHQSAEPAGQVRHPWLQIWGLQNYSMGHCGEIWHLG